MSRRRQTLPSIRYSLSPERYSRRETSTSRATMGGEPSELVSGPSSSDSEPTASRAPVDSLVGGAKLTFSGTACGRCPLPFPVAFPAPLARVCPLEPAILTAVTPRSISLTSAAPVALRPSVPPKMTSSIRSPRRLFALCSPNTQVMASTTLLLPHPLGPTIAVTPSSKRNWERSGKLLKPEISRCCRFITSPSSITDEQRSGTVREISRTIEGHNTSTIERLGALNTLTGTPSGDRPDLRQGSPNNTQCTRRNQRSANGPSGSHTLVLVHTNQAATSPPGNTRKCTKGPLLGARLN